MRDWTTATPASGVAPAGEASHRYRACNSGGRASKHRRSWRGGNDERTDPNRSVVHVTITPNGHVSTVVDNFSVECG
jgi:hypothetical protein